MGASSRISLPSMSWGSNLEFVCFLTSRSCIGGKERIWHFLEGHQVPSPCSSTIALASLSLLIPGYDRGGWVRAGFEGTSWEMSPSLVWLSLVVLIYPWGLLLMERVDCWESSQIILYAPASLLHFSQPSPPEIHMCLWVQPTHASSMKLYGMSQV